VPRRAIELAGVAPRIRFGEKKVEMYGKEILDVLRRFREGERATTKAN